MDKPKKGNTITIKINGDQKNYQDEAQELQPDPYTESIPEPIVEIEPVDLLAKKESAVAEESADDSFEWMIPESSEIDRDPFKLTASKSPITSSKNKSVSLSTLAKNRNPRPLGSIIISSVFAILIGTLIGVLMLKLVITESGEKEVTQPTVVDKAIEDKETKAGITLTTQPLTTFVIQGGVFTSKEGADETVNDFKSNQIPFQLIEAEGKYSIFIGAADTIETAKSLGAQYKLNGAGEVYAKSFVIDEKKFMDLSKADQTFVELVPEIYQTLSRVTSNGLIQQSLSADSTKSLDGLEGSLKSAESKNEHVIKLKDELSSALNKVKSYGNTKEAIRLNEAQQHLLNFLSIYYEIK